MRVLRQEGPSAWLGEQEWRTNSDPISTENAKMDKVHSAAADHLPAFITAPGNTDVLMVVSAIVLIATVLGAGVFFLWLHSLLVIKIKYMI